MTYSKEISVVSMKENKNLTILLVIDTNSGFFPLLYVDLWVAEDFLLLPGPLTIKFPYLVY